MPAPTKKSPAKKKAPPAVEAKPVNDEHEPAPAIESTAPDAAEAAADEATNPDGPLVVEFRGEKFEIDRAVLTSARFLLSLRKFRYQDLLYEILGPDDNTERFIGLVKFKEQIPEVANEFLAAVNAAAGWGNSSTS